MPITTEAISKSTETHGQTTRHILKFKICNTGTEPVEIKLADNPWRQRDPTKHTVFGPKLHRADGDPTGEVKPDETRQKALDAWRNPETGDASGLTLGAKGSPNACHEFTVAYDFEPSCLYIDVFVRQADGKYIWDESTGWPNLTQLWDDIKLAAHFPNGPRPQFVAVLPLWFPMSLEALWGGDIAVALEGLHGLPREVEVVHSFPAFGAAHSLTFGDRESQCAVVLRQRAPLAGRHYVEARYRIVEPAELADCRRHVGFWLSGAGPAG